MLLGPTVATLGLSVQIPMAAGADLALGRAKWIESGKVGTRMSYFYTCAWLTLSCLLYFQTLMMTAAGTALILCGFFGINLFGQKVGGEIDEGSSPGSKRKNSDLQEQQGLLVMMPRLTDDGAPLAAVAEAGQMCGDGVACPPAGQRQEYPGQRENLGATQPVSGIR